MTSRWIAIAGSLALFTFTGLAAIAQQTLGLPHPGAATEGNYLTGAGWTGTIVKPTSPGAAVNAFQCAAKCSTANTCAAWTWKPGSVVPPKRAGTCELYGAPIKEAKTPGKDWVSCTRACPKPAAPASTAKVAPNVTIPKGAVTPAPTIPGGLVMKPGGGSSNPAPGTSLPAYTFENYQVVSGGPVSIRAGETGQAIARCPAGTVPYGAAYTMSGVDPSAMELKGAAPQTDRTVIVKARNASTGAAAMSLTATTACTSPPPGYRIETRTITLAAAARPADSTVTASCRSDEIVLGGGFMADAGLHPLMNQPQAKTGWKASAVAAGPTDSGQLKVSAVCARKESGGYAMTATSESTPDGGTIGPGATRAMTTSCFGYVSGGGMVVLAPHMAHVAVWPNQAALLATSIRLSADGRTLTASVLNRDPETRADELASSLGAICATLRE
jgi:hypothetical protein